MRSNPHRKRQAQATTTRKPSEEHEDQRSHAKRQINLHRKDQPPDRSGRRWRMVACANAALAVAIALAAVPRSALADQPGTFADLCVARAVQTPGRYASLKAMNEACGLRTTTPNPSAPPAPRVAAAGVAAPASDPCDGCEYYIYSGDSENVINAKGCATSTILITYPVSSACEGGANEIWELAALSSGYRALIAYYDGTVVCMTAGPESGDRAGAQPCTNPVQSYMEFRRPVVSESCYSGWYYIVPAANYGLTLNVRGGLGAKREIISYPISCADNSVWYYD